MTKNVFGIVMFVAGAVVGVAATHKFFKDKYVKKSKEDMLKFKNLGQKSLDEVIKKLEDMGFGLRVEEE